VEVNDDKCLKFKILTYYRNGLNIMSSLSDCIIISTSMQALSPEDHRFIGVHGQCQIQRLLWYMDYNRICLSPLCHALYRGIFRDWLLAITSTIESLSKPQIVPIRGLAPRFLRPEHALSRAQRAECIKRMSTMVFTHEFDRPPECPLKHAKSQTMEQLIRQLDCVLPLLFAEVCS